MATIAAVGAMWAGWRCHRELRSSATADRDCRSENIWLLPVASIFFGGVVGIFGKWIDVRPFGFFLFLMVAVMTAIYVLLRSRRPQFFYSGETALLVCLCGACLAVTVLDVRQSTQFKIDWVFEPDDPGAFLSSPCVPSQNDATVYVAAAHQSGFRQWGTVYAVDGTTGKAIWRFSNNDSLKPVFSSLCLVENRLYFGEGLHSDSDCKLFCIDAETGKKVWEFSTSSHVESSPLVALGRVFFGAGDDGFYCVDAVDGKEIWHLKGYHVDATPAVSEAKEEEWVFVGSCGSPNYRFAERRLFALNAESGQQIWSVPIDLNCFSSPAFGGDTVQFSLGSGDLESSGPTPAGAVLALDKLTGREVWRVQLPDAVVSKPITSRNSHTLVGCRDGDLYLCIDEKLEKHPIGDSILAAPWPLGLEDFEDGIAVITEHGRAIKVSAVALEPRYENDLVNALGGVSGHFVARPTSVNWRIGPIFIAGTVRFGITDKPCLFRLRDGY